MLELLLGNNGLAAIIAFALVLIPAVIIHELGHFFAGKAAGITILEFGIGFPPRVGRLFTWRGTEFTLNWLPLGGFVRPLGEDMVRPRGEEEENVDRTEALERGITNIKSVSEAKPLERIGFLSAGAIANLISAFALFVIVGMLGVAGSRINVIEVSNDSALAKAGLQANDVIESLNGKTFLDSSDFFDELSKLDEGQTAEIVIRRGESGEIVNLTYLSPGEFDSFDTDLRVRIMGVVEDAPAGEAGILAGDLVISLNNDPISSVDQLIALVNQNLGQEVSMTLSRMGEVYETQLIPRANPPEGEGAMGIEINSAIRDIGTGIIYQPLFQQVVVNLSFGESIQYSYDRFVSLFSVIAQLPGQILQGNISAEEARPVSIVGISQVGGFYLQQSIEQQRPVVILNYIAIISIALGLTNLLPLPALDGGRILFVLIEMVRGKPIPPEREGIVHLLGLVFLLSLTIIIMINDIVNPITNLIP